MMNWLLRRLAWNPRAAFSERELDQQDRAGFLRLRQEQLLRRQMLQAEQGIYQETVGSRVLTVTQNPDGSHEAFDEDDPEFDPVQVSVADLYRWVVDLHRLTTRFRETNRLTGRSGQLGERLLLLGTGLDAFAVILAFLPNASVAEPLLMALPQLLLPEHAGALVLSQQYLPSLALSRSLERLHVLCAGLDRLQPFELTEATLLSVSGHAARQQDARIAAQPERFRYSPGFRSVHLHGKTYALTSQQAQVVEILYRNWHNRTPDVPVAYILERLAPGEDAEPGEPRERKLQDTFRRSPEAWAEVITQGATRGTMRLNLPYPGEQTGLT